ncbi:hypothetical protein DJ71_07040, partial [Halorubrum sp. E3]
KAYGLAGLRIGYSVVPEAWGEAYARVNTPFAANELACRAALAALDPDPDLETAFALAVDDPLVDWHERPVRVAVADGAVDAERVDPDVSGSVDADVSAGIGALSQLYAGYRDIDDLRAHAALDLADGAPDGLAADLAALFPPRRTFLREGF